MARKAVTENLLYYGDNLDVLRERVATGTGRSRLSGSSVQVEPLVQRALPAPER